MELTVVLLFFLDFCSFNQHDIVSLLIGLEKPQSLPNVSTCVASFHAP